MTASAAASSRTIAFADTGQPSWQPVSGAGRPSVTHRRASTAPRRKAVVSPSPLPRLSAVICACSTRRSRSRAGLLTTRLRCSLQIPGRQSQDPSAGPRRPGPRRLERHGSPQPRAVPPPATCSIRARGLGPVPHADACLTFIRYAMKLDRSAYRSTRGTTTRSGTKCINGASACRPS
jgi:hypothetical protein